MWSFHYKKVFKTHSWTFFSGHTKRNSFWNPRWQAIKLLWFGIILEKIQLQGVCSKPTFNFRSSISSSFSSWFVLQITKSVLRPQGLSSPPCKFWIVRKWFYVRPTKAWPTPISWTRYENNEIFRQARLGEKWFWRRNYQGDDGKWRGKRKRFNNHILICHHCRRRRSHLW